MKKKVAFYLRKFFAGGIETTLVQYLNNFDYEQYEVTLVIGLKTYPQSPLLLLINKNVDIKYLIDETFLSQCKFLQYSAENIQHNKLLHNLITKPMYKIALNKRVVLELNKHDSIVDYSLNLDDLARKITAKKIGYSHFRLSHHYTPNKRTKRLNRVLPMYDRVVVITEKMRSDAQKIFVHCADKFVLMYNQFSQKDIYARLATSSNEDIPLDGYIVSCGRLNESQKDFTSLIKAYHVLKHEYKIKQKLLIIGDGDSKEELQKLVESLNLTKDVLLVGYRANPFYLVSNAQLFVLSSKHEGLPSVLIEAMMLGVPVVSTDCPDGPAEILLQGNAGMLVKVGDVHQLVESILAMLTNHELVNDKLTIANGAISRFEISQNMDKFYNIIDCSA